jgi:hypothetical protein
MAAFNLSPFWLTTFMLVASNLFMTMAWYGHLKHLNNNPWLVAALVSWGIALFEYLLQVPATQVPHLITQVIDFPTSGLAKMPLQPYGARRSRAANRLSCSGVVLLTPA